QGERGADPPAPDQLADAGDGPEPEDRLRQRGQGGQEGARGEQDAARGVCRAWTAQRRGVRQDRAAGRDARAEEVNTRSSGAAAEPYRPGHPASCAPCPFLSKEVVAEPCFMVTSCRPGATKDDSPEGS